MINSKFKPGWIKKIWFKECDFGTTPLEFFGVKGSGDEKNVAWMDMEFSLNCKHSHIVLAVDIVQAHCPLTNSALPPLQLCIVLNDLCVKGNLRVGFGTPIDCWPGFGAVHISFASKPVIDFTLQPLGSFLPQIRPVTNLIIRLARDGIGSALVWPKQIIMRLGSCPDDVEVEMPEFDDTETGVLHVELLEAKELKGTNLFGNSDPYVIMTCSEKQEQKSSCISGTVNPKWSESYDFVIDNPMVDVLNFQVWNKNFPGIDDNLGTVKVDLAAMDLEKPSSHDLWLFLQSDGTASNQGQLHVVLKWEPFAAMKLEQDMPEMEGAAATEEGAEPMDPKAVAKAKKHQKLEAEHNARQKQIESIRLKQENHDIKHLEEADVTAGDKGAGMALAGIVHVKVVKATDLIDADDVSGLGFSMTGVSDPYCVVTLGREESKTPTVQDNLNPIWNHECSFLSTSPAFEILNFQLFDAGIATDDTLGKVDIRVHDIQKAGRIIKEYTVEEGQGDLHLELLWEDPDAKEKAANAAKIRAEKDKVAAAEAAKAQAALDATPEGKQALEDKAAAEEQKANAERKKKAIEEAAAKEAEAAAKLEREEAILKRNEAEVKKKEAQAKLEAETKAEAEHAASIKSHVGSIETAKSMGSPRSPKSPKNKSSIPKGMKVGGGTSLAGLLIVTVRRCKDLTSQDTFSSSDPYCQLELGKDHQKTKIIDNNNNPEWNQVYMDT